MSNKVTNLVLLVAVSCAAACAQDSSPSLGDVVRHQQQDKQHKKAKRVVSDEDVGGFHKHEVSGYAAGTVIIPAIRITGEVPDGVPIKIPVDPKQKMIISFPSIDSCFDVSCGEAEFLHLFPGMYGGTPKVLFESDETIQGNAARVVHFEAMHDERGKMFATVAFIQTPASIATAACLYKATDAPDVETDCEAFIDSLQIHVPERYIYVQHPNY